MATFRKLTFSLKHLSARKQREITFLVNSFRSLTQSYITTLYKVTPNLALYNQDCPKESQLTANKATLDLVVQDRLSARYQSQCLKQAIETLSSIDNKKTEQAYVLEKGQRQAKCPTFKGYPQLDSKFIIIQFKTDDPTLLARYPAQAYVKEPQKDKNKQFILDEHGQPILIEKQITHSVIAVSSADWKKHEYPKHYDLCIRLSRPRGDAILHKRVDDEPLTTKTILPILLKQNKPFKHWLHYQKTLSTDLIQTAVLIPFVEIHSNKLALDFDLLCFNSDETHGIDLKDQVYPQSQKRRKQQDQTPQWIYNLSEKPMAGNASYVFEPTDFYRVKDKTDPDYMPLTAKQKQKRTHFTQLIESFPKAQVWGMDVGQTKLAVLTNHDQAGLDSQQQALFIGKDHRDWLTQLVAKHSEYQKLTNLYKKSGSTLHRKQKAQAKAELIHLKQKYHQYIKSEFKSLPWDQIKVLVIENLNSLKISSKDKKSLGRQFNKRNAQWAYDQVMGELLKTVQENGVYLVSVSPMYTSKECPLCGIVPELLAQSSNRSGETYRCRCCSDKGNVLKLDADYVGSHNIRSRLYYWLKHQQMPYQYKKRKIDKFSSDPTLVKDKSSSLAFPDGGNPEVPEQPVSL